MAQQWEEVRRLFHQALELESEKRSDFLAKACLGQDELRLEVQSLLDAFTRAQSFIEPPSENGVLETNTLPLSNVLTESADWRLRSDARYEVSREYARGGIGRILEANDQNLRRTVAVKELLSRDPVAEARFMREAYITARLQHPSIVPIYEIGRWSDGTPFFAMKMVSGRSLAEVIKEKKTVNERLALLPHIIAVAEAIAYAHQQRIIHRDLKPSNILLGPFGETVVIDWGLAADLNEINSPVSQPGDQSLIPELTVAGTVMGTPEYMSPEQLRGLAVDEKADVYCLGAVLHHTLTGRAPFTVSSTPARISGGPFSRRPVPTRLQERGIPAELAAIVQKAMSEDPADRYPIAAELAEDLRRFQAGRLVSVHQYSPTEIIQKWVTRHKGFVASAAVFVILSIAIAILSFIRIQRARDIAETRSQDLLVVSAREALRYDPTRALATLKGLSTEKLSTVGLELAADAVSRGVAKYVLFYNGIYGAEPRFHTSREIVYPGRDHFLHVLNVETGRDIQLFGFRGREQVLVSNGRHLILGDEEKNLWRWDFAEKKLTHLGTTATRVRTAAIDSSGEVAVIGLLSGLVTLWFLDGRTVEVGQHSGRLNVLAISPNDKWFASGGLDHGLKLWNMTTHELLGSFNLDGEVLAVTFSNDGKTVGAGTSNGTLYLIDLSTLSVRREPLHTTMLRALAFSPDGNEILSGGADRRIRLKNIHRDSAIDFEHPNSVSRVAFDRIGQRFASGDIDGTVRIWDRDDRDGVILQGHRDLIGCIEFSDDHDFLLTSARDGMIRVWDLAAVSRRRINLKHQALYDLVITSDERVVAAGADLSLQTLDLSTGKATVLETEFSTQKIYISPNEKFLVTRSTDSGLTLWQRDNGSTQVLSEKRTRSARFSPDSLHLSFADLQGNVFVCDLPNCKPRLLAHFPENVDVITMDPSGPRIIMRTGDSYALRHLTAGETTPLEPVDFTHVTADLREFVVPTTEVSADKRLLAARYGNSVAVWDVATGRLRARWDHDSSVVSLAIFEGRFFASGAVSGSIRLWDSVREKITSFNGHQGMVRGLAFSPTGDVLISGAEDKTVRLWHTDNALQRILRGPDGWIANVAFTPDNRSIASASWDGSITVWPIHPRLNIPAETGQVRAWLSNLTNASLADFQYSSQ